MVRISIEEEKEIVRNNSKTLIWMNIQSQYLEYMEGGKDNSENLIRLLYVGSFFRKIPKEKQTFKIQNALFIKLNMIFRKLKVC